MNIKATVITVSYNSEKTIERTIKSVLDQTCDDLEYIIVDGASTDGTMDIVRKYEPMFNGRLRYISEPDKGMYNAMNKGIGMATHPSCFVTKDACDILGGFDERYKYVEEYDLMLRANEDKRIKFIPVDAHTSNYVTGGVSASGKAYIELLPLQARYGIISKKEFFVNSFKARLAALFIKLGLKPITLRKQ